MDKYIVLGRVYDKKNLIGIKVISIKTYRIQYIKKVDFVYFFNHNVILNCKYTKGGLLSNIKELPLKYLFSYDLYGNEIHSGLYTELQLISIFTKIDVDDLSIHVCGAVCGAITNEYSDEADLHAKNYYGLVRSMSTDIYKIAKNTGFKRSEIAKIKNYVFMDYHELATGWNRFEPTFTIALSWQRLIEGNYLPHDITLLKHELYEMQLIEKGKTQDEAHILAQKKYNYDKEVKDYHAKSGKY